MNIYVMYTYNLHLICEYHHTIAVSLTPTHSIKSLMAAVLFF